MLVEIKTIYIRLTIMIYLDGNVLSFALVSKQKLTKIKLKYRQKAIICIMSLCVLDRTLVSHLGDSGSIPGLSSPFVLFS